MNFEVRVWTGTDSDGHEYSGRYETRDSGVLLVIDERSGRKITYGPAGWLWVQESAESDADR